MTVYLMQIDFHTQGPFGEQMSEVYAPLAQDIAGTQGLIWKIWTENQETSRAGGWYAFSDYESLVAYQEMHCARLTSFGITDIETKIFTPNVALSVIDHFPADLIS
ncbi:monooxygenase [Wohlfahrtiimonas sp. G9077]|uniref:monooxygenase n=1 Tax=Wohlfahrtiimonas sp. G9077 TaxID=1980118 RepID=UPI000B990066|nr:monooxygenase [Wohlfahrtiimonas sp. G9077]OYQ73751.1 monooxygenase [Wohlfahrtiimonas sp. G9077]